MGKPRVGKNEKSNWEASSPCFSHSYCQLRPIFFQVVFIFLGLITLVYEGHDYHS